MLNMLIIIINNAAGATLAVPDSDAPEALTDDRPWRVSLGRMLADAAMRCEPTGLSQRLSRAAMAINRSPGGGGVPLRESD